MYLKDIIFKDVGWIYLSDFIVLLNIVMNLQISYEMEFLG